MTENQKLREALRELMSIVSIHQKATRNNFAWAEMDFAREALATTEPEPTGMPELPPLPRCMYQNMQHQRMYIGKVYTADQVKAYGEQCWKAGYKHGAWGGDARDAARYRWLADSNNYYEAINLISDGSLTEDALCKAIDAAMANGVKG